MGIDTSIYGNLLRPVRSVADYDAEAQAQQQNALALRMSRQKMAEYDRGLQEQGVIRNALLGLGGNATDEARINVLKATGLPQGFAQADALTKAMLERQRAAAEVAHKAAQTKKELGGVVDASLKRYRAALDFVDSPEAAARWMQAQYQDPEIGEYVARTLGPFNPASLPTPQNFAEWRQRAALGMEKHIEATQNQARIAETGRHNVTTETETARNNRAQNAVAQGNLGVAQGNLGVARQRLAFDQTTGFENKLAAKEEKKAAAADKAVTKFSDTLQKEGIPELETAVSGAEGALNRYPKGRVPGIGAAKNALPAFMMSDEGKDVRQALASVRNIVLSARSGAAVTDQELRRLVEEIGTGVGMSEDDIRKGLTKVRARLDSIKSNAAAGVDDAVLQTYTDRGGIPIKRGGSAPAPTAPAAVKSGTDLGGGFRVK